MSTGEPGDIDVSGAVGIPDGLERIWTPHRLAYIRGESKPTGDPNDPAVCPFCLIPTRPDAESLVVARGALTYAVLNLYPYNAGHLLVVPYRHVPDISELGVDEAAEFMAFTQRAIGMIRAVSSAQGFNIGMNVGIGRGCRDRRAPASARCPAMGRRQQLHADHRSHASAATVAA